MQSRTSYFNPTLFRRNLTRFWPLWGLASFIGALFPLAVLLDMVHRGWHSFSGPEFTQMYYNAVSAVPVISLVYAALCAMAVWGYLHNTRSVGLMHTLPIRREGLFLTNFLSGLTMTLIPYAVTGILCVVVSLCGGAFDARGLAVTVLAVLGESFFYFSSATFVAFITGNVFAMPPLYALLHFLAVLLDWLISSFAQGFIFGFSTNYTGVVEWLSPTVYLVSRVYPDGQYTEVQRTLADGTSYTDRVLTSVDLENFWLVGVYALAGLALALLALLLYRSRRSETAGDVVAVGWLRPVFRYGVAGLCALLGGQLLYSLFWYGFQQGDYYDTLPMVVCLLAAGTIGYYGASMLLAKSLRVFRGSWRGLAIVLAGCALVCCVLHFDLLGVADRVPEASQIRSVDIRVSDNSYTFTPEDTTTYAAVTDAQLTGFTVNTKTLTVADWTLADTQKVYDGSKEFAVSSVTPDGVVGSDAVSVDLDAVYGEASAADVGTYDVALCARDGQPVLTGANAVNYTLDLSEATPIHGEITPCKVTLQQITFADKTYDGTTDVAADSATYTFAKAANHSQIVPDLPVEGLHFAVSDGHARDNKAVNVWGTGVLAPGDKTKNYFWDGNISGLAPTVNIVARPITLSLEGSLDKVSDGTNAVIADDPTALKVAVTCELAGVTAQVDNTAGWTYASADASAEPLAISGMTAFLCPF